MTTRSHYDALGVPPWASADEVQRAYRQRARLLHPDRLASRPLSDVDRVRAEARIREVNEAWRVLREPAARAAYDARLRPAGIVRGTDPDVASASPGAWPGPFASPPRPVPRRRDPQRPRPSDDPATARHLGFILWTGFTIVLIVIFVASAYLGHSSTAPGQKPSTTVAGGPCVRVSVGPKAIAVPCSSPNDGRLVAHVMTPSECPAGSTARRIEAGDPGLSCLAPAS